MPKVFKSALEKKREKKETTTVIFISLYFGFLLLWGWLCFLLRPSCNYVMN